MATGRKLLLVKDIQMAQQKVAKLPPEDLSVVDELQPGTKLLQGQYTITRFLNNGGFGITYLAKNSLDRNVVIKECFPNAFCRRSKATVAARSRAHQSDLRLVVQLFVREAHNLAKIIHPNIVAVHQVFEDNGTAYMAIDYIDGLDLLEMIESKKNILSPDAVVLITEKMLSAVGFIHENNMLHRDISPDNILITMAGEPILIDFGAAREQASQKSRALTALRVVKDGYSPQEFYIAGSEQGPWSDLYALGATLYHVITGAAPINGQARLAALAETRPDPYEPLAGRFEGYPDRFLEAIDQVMNTIPRNRLQSAAEWLAFWKGDGASDQIDGEASERATPDAVAESNVVRHPGAAARVGKTVSQDLLARVVTQATGDTAPTRSASRSSPVPILAGVAAAVAIAGLVFAFVGGSDEPATPEVAATPAVETPEVAAAEPTTTAVEAEPVAAAEAEPAAAATPTVPAVPTEPEKVAPVAEAETEVATADPTPDVPVAPAGPVAAVQVAFAAWDVRMPFAEVARIAGGKPTIVVSHVSQTADLAVSGEWIKPGVIINAVNEKPIQSGATVAGMVLNDLHVDPDGYGRAAIKYTDASGTQQTGLLAAQTVRNVSLANGIVVSTAVIEGSWKATVQSVSPEAVTKLQVGDVIFRDKTTGVALDGPQTFEEVMAALVEQKRATTEFAVIRGSGVEAASMQLAIDATEAASE